MACALFQIFYKTVLRVHEDALWRRRLFAQFKAHNNNLVALLHEVRGGAINSDHAGTALAFDDIRFKSRAICIIHDHYFFPLGDVRLDHEFFINRHRPDVVEVRLGHGRVVDLGAEKLAHVREEYNQRPAARRVPSLPVPELTPFRYDPRMEVPSARRFSPVRIPSLAAFALLALARAAGAQATAAFPDLHGLSSAEAFARLTGSGFTAATARDLDTNAALVAPGVASDFVVWQSQSPGAIVDLGASIQFHAKSLCEVPDLELAADGATPLDVATAVDRARRAGRFILNKYDPANPDNLLALNPSTDYAATVKSGSQKPPKGTKKPAGSTVGVIINISPDTATPNPAGWFGIGFAVGVAAAAVGVLIVSAAAKRKEDS